MPGGLPGKSGQLSSANVGPASEGTELSAASLYRAPMTTLSLHAVIRQVIAEQAIFVLFRIPRWTSGVMSVQLNEVRSWVLRTQNVRDWQVGIGESFEEIAPRALALRNPGATGRARLPSTPASLA